MKEIELIEKRKPREKHFLREDGTFVVKLYNEDMHYKKNNRYEEIDNTLIKENDCYYNKNNDFKVRFKNSGKDSLIRIEKEDNFLDIKLKESQNSKLAKKNQVSKFVENVEYKDILDNIDIEYKTLPTKVKETIILKNNKYNKINFIVNTNLHLEQNGSYITAKNDNQKIFQIDPPYIEDSDGKLNSNVSYNLTFNGQSYELELILDTEWLNSNEIKYPVYIDPTISNINQTGGVYDTYIYPGDTDVDRNSHAVLKAGIEKINGTNRENRALIKFDLPEIGTGSEIVDAYINLTSYPSLASTSIENSKLVSVHRITENWDESTATWNTMNDKYDSKAEAIFESRRSTVLGDTVIASAVGGSIANLVKKWYKDTPNYGMMIKSVSQEYIDEDYPAFFSKDNGMSGDPKPILTIVYRNQNGIEGYLNYQKQAYSKGTAYVNTYNGNLTTVFNIGETIGGILPANLQLIYNSNDVVLSKNVGLGNGFKFNYYQTLKSVTIDSKEYIEYVDEDGTIHYFRNKTTLTPSGEEIEETIYVDEDGLGLTLEKTETEWTITDKEKGRMSFSKYNDYYRLFKINDIDNNTIELQFIDEKISKIYDKYFHEISINYNTNSIQIISSDSTTTLEYENNQIKNIITSIGNISIEYNTEGLISSIKDVNGIKTSYEYYSQKPYKVKTVKRFGLNDILGQSFTLEYGFNSTTITDSNNQCDTLIFNSYGNLLSQNSLSSSENINDAYSTTQVYGNENSNFNRILSTVNPVKYIKNYMKNSSFEFDNDNFSIMEQNNQLVRSFSSEYAYSGNRSLKLECLSAGQSVKQNLALEKGKYYTFSGYFKNDQPLKIKLSYSNSDGQLKEKEEVIEASDDFSRNDITIYYGNDATTNLCIELIFISINIIYLDDVQMEEGEVANSYNIIENSDFSEGKDDWTFEALDENREQVSPDQFFEVVNFNNNQNKALKVKMNPLYITSFKKEFPIKGKKGDLYTISFWYKNEGVSGCRQYAGNTVTINFKPVDGEAEYCVLSSPNFNPNGDRWQYFSYRNSALEDFKAIELIFTQNTEINNFYLTNLSFYKEITGGDFKYDDNGNIVSLSDEAKNEKTFSYNSQNQLINATSSIGRNYKYEYDKENPNRIINYISDSGIANEIIYNDEGYPITTKISKKIVTESEPLDGDYRIRSYGTQKYLKAKYKDIVCESNPCSNTIWKLERHDDKYKIIYSIIPNYSLAIKNNKLCLSNEDQNNLFYISQNNEGDGSYRISQGEVGERVNIKANNDSSVEISTINLEDNSFNFYIEHTNSFFLENNATYTEDGRFITSVTDENGSKTEYTTDSNTGLVTSIKDANNNTLEYEYNNKLQLTKITASSKTVQYSYNQANLLSKVATGNKEYNIEYDNFLNTKSVKIGNSITLFNKEYDDIKGNLKSITYGNNQSIGYEYDNFSRMNKIIKEDDTYSIKYDNNGNIAKIISNNAIEKFKYDIGNRLYEYNNDYLKLNYQYDSDNNLIMRKYKFGLNEETITRSIDKDSIINELNINNTIINYEHDDLLRTTEKNIDNKYQIKYKFLNYGNKTTALIESIQNGNDIYNYKYNKLNKISAIYRNGALLKKYYYNQYDELITEEDYEDSKNEKTEYTYDLYGNLLSKTTTALSTGEVTSTKIYEYNNINWKDQLTKYDNCTITYDEVGNPITIGNTINLTWKNGKELSRYINTEEDKTINFKYNESGIRTSKIVNDIETKYYLEGTNVLLEKNGTNTLFFIRDEEGLIGFKYNDEMYYYIKNLQEDIIGILNSSGEKIVEYQYDSWGKVTKIIDTSNINLGEINPYRYRSYYYDKETKLYYLIKRYYNPEWGRFINADETFGMDGTHNGYNLYTYVNNDPINNIDDQGDFLKKILKKAKKAVKKVVKTVKKVVKKVAKVVKKVVKTVVKTTVAVVKTVTNTLYNWSTAVNNSFECSGSIGGNSGNKLNPIKTTGTVGFEISDCELKRFTSVNVQGGPSAFHIDYEAKRYETDEIDPVTGDYLLGDPEGDFIVETGFKGLVASKPVSSDEMFIGLDFGSDKFFVFNFRIGFNIKVS